MLAGAVAVAAWSVWRWRLAVAAAEADPYEMQDMGEDGGIIGDLVGSVESMMTGTDEALRSGNVRAFLMLIRSGESSVNERAYRMVVYGGEFSSFADHPRVFKLAPDGRRTSAAGAYQITATTWDSLGGRRAYGDFSPAAQDRAAVDLIRRRGALADVVAGRWRAAVRKLRQEWTSLPGAMEQGYSMDRAAAVLARYGYQEGVAA